ncbi:hypothetical protein HZA44_00805 [Candidatus Peregrinibacteria bacterium]|nr:hypothetical protein [Candidatus Peregrinibacteria bacterium]
MKKGISLSIGFVTIVLGALFCVGIQGSLAALLPTSSSIQNQAPAFTAGPSDGGSSVATPTTAGNNVTFTATATDANGEQYYLAICKTNAIGAGDNVAPTCPGGSWAISTATNTGVGASVTYLTSTPDATANVWYAFVCDKVVGGGSCSSTSQGSGDVGSPFVVNHIPTQSTPSTRAHAFLDANSVGYWQFEDGTGTTSFVDKTSNHNGTCSGGACPTWTQEGAIGGGVRFDGVNDTVSLGNDIFTNAQLASGSVSLWVYVNSIASDFLPINLEGVVWVGQATGLCPAGNWCANLNSVNNSFMNG